MPPDRPARPGAFCTPIQTAPAGLTRLRIADSAFVKTVGASGNVATAAPYRIIGRWALYNRSALAYNVVMSASEHIMTVSQNGQVSIPAATRARWKARRVIVVDLGDRVVMRPTSDKPIADLEGKYRGRGPTSDQAHRRARQAEASRER